MVLLEGGKKPPIHWESEGEDRQADSKLKAKRVKYLSIKDEPADVKGV